MAEYYPLLAKAVASLPNSTPESRKVVYERARKALIGQLRTLHPPVPDEDIERESVALDRAVERLESELSAPAKTAPAPSASPTSPSPSPSPAKAEAAPRFPTASGSLGPSAIKPFTPLRTKVSPPKIVAKRVTNGAAPSTTTDVPALDAPPSPLSEPTPPAGEPTPPPGVETQNEAPPPDPAKAKDLGDARGKARSEPQRPIAPQPPEPKGPKRPLWIIPAGVGLVMVLIGGAAYKLRDRPELLVRSKPTQEAPADSNKIVERVGGGTTPDSGGSRTLNDQTVATQSQPSAKQVQQAQPQQTGNPAAPVAGRAALLVEAPDEPSKVKTYLGTVVWRLDNVSDGQNQAVGLAVRADIDLPDDKLKATVVFQKNTDASLPASHTMKVRFLVQPSSPTGSVKQINVPQMRREDSSTGDPLDGVTVPIVENSFLIGLSPGNSENANLELLRAREWIDIPIFLSNSKIAKLTFEKTDAGQRDIQEAIAAWTKP